MLITYSSQRIGLKKAYPAQVAALGFQICSFDFAGNLFQKTFQIRELKNFLKKKRGKKEKLFM